jgi:hypothetical protein
MRVLASGEAGLSMLDRVLLGAWFFRSGIQSAGLGVVVAKAILY